MNSAIITLQHFIKASLQYGYLLGVALREPYLEGNDDFSEIVVTSVTMQVIVQFMMYTQFGTVLVALLSE